MKPGASGDFVWLCPDPIQNSPSYLTVRPPEGAITPRVRHPRGLCNDLARSCWRSLCWRLWDQGLGPLISDLSFREPPDPVGTSSGTTLPGLEVRGFHRHPRPANPIGESDAICQRRILCHTCEKQGCPGGIMVNCACDGRAHGEEAHVMRRIAAALRDLLR
jgi:hypothetical protein